MTASVQRAQLGLQLVVQVDVACAHCLVGALVQRGVRTRHGRHDLVDDLAERLTAKHCTGARFSCGLSLPRAQCRSVDVNSSPVTRAARLPRS